MSKQPRVTDPETALPAESAVVEPVEIEPVALIVEPVSAPADEPAAEEDMILVSDWLASAMQGDTRREATLVFAARYGSSADRPSRIEARFQEFLSAPA